MYQRRNQMQEFVICLIDAVCVGCSFIVAGLIRFNAVQKFQSSTDVTYALISVILIFLVIFFLTKLCENISFRGALEEFIKVAEFNIVYLLTVTAFSFFTKNAFSISRLTMAYFIILCQFTIFAAHQIFKAYMLHIHRYSAATAKMILLTTKDRLEEVVHGLSETRDWSYEVVAAAVIDDENVIGTKVDGIPVVAGKNDFIDYVLREVIDEVFIHIPDNRDPELRSLIMELENMGVVVHLNIDMFDLGVKDSRRIYRIGSYYALVFASRLFDYRKIILKRLIDIVGSVVGLAFTGVVTVFLAPVLLWDSPGPLIFKQKRVGKNGRVFYIYKFRSMCVDAEEKKAELMKQNEMQGSMFKMKDDPRVTRVGKFIRRTSIDELPQFFNVLKGDMSLVGTRPPTEEEFKLYESYQKRRLSIKPGITGLWQISGRSEITDFEEVVKLDLEYIDNWSIILDIKILVKTVGVIFSGRGAS